ncbi:hypothetical protein L208DRAFT_1291554 [Tricholoma matsutake]|nr:hypothetical protein L208DRAFT_1291554 [Tricholoma matsutake 945]
MLNNDGQPEEQRWSKALAALDKEMEEAQAQCSFALKDLDHHRGFFPALAAGISFGGGQTMPGNLAHSRPNHKVLQKLLHHPSLIRISNFANGAFATWFPKMYKYYYDTLRPLYKWDDELEHLFLDSIWTAISLNFGPATWCY